MPNRRTRPSIPMWRPPDLKNRVAVVTGASRGAGRGIATVLGECCATVFVTGRSVRGRPTTDNLRGTIDDTAEEVTARGGRGIAVQCDHTVEEQVQALFNRVRNEQGRLDILVNNAWAGYEGERLVPSYFWQAPLRLWETMFVAGLKAHLLACYFAIPLMLPRRQGLIVSTVAWDHDKYFGGFYDISKHAIVRMIHGLGIELRQHNIAAVAVAPGWMRTERVLAVFKTDAEKWRTIPALKKTESPEYVGRAVAMLAADRKILGRSGCAFRVGDLAREYKFSDIDGRRVAAFTIPPFQELMEQFERKQE